MSDFIREVDEDYRRERAANFLKRFQVPLAVLVILIVAGAGTWRWIVDRQAARAADANAKYQQAETLVREGKMTEAAERFAAMSHDAPGGYQILAQLRAAEARGAVDPEAGAKQLDALASDETGAHPALRDLARYRGAILRIDHQDPRAFDAQYGRFALDSFAFHNGMRELLALAALKRSDFAAATKYLNDVITDPLTPPALRNRAQAYRELVAAGPVTSLAGQPGPGSVKQIAGPAPATAASSSEIAPVETQPAPASSTPKPAPAAPTPVR